MGFYPGVLPTLVSPAVDVNGIGDPTTKSNGSIFRPRDRSFYADELKNVLYNLHGLAVALGMPTGAGSAFAQLASLTSSLAGLSAAAITTAGAGLTKSGTAVNLVGDATLTVSADSVGVAASGVGATQLAANAVITAKIADANVTDAKLAANAVTTAKITDANVTYAKLALGTALSVLGVTGNVNATLADIVAGTDGHVLRRNGAALAFGQIVAAGIAASAVTMAKLAAWPSAATYKSAGQSVLNNTPGVVIAIDSQDYTATGGSDAPTVDVSSLRRVTIVKPGLYRMTATLGYQPATSVAANSVIGVYVYVNGAAVAEDIKPAVLGTGTMLTAWAQLNLIATDYIEIRTFQNTGNSQNTLGTASQRPRLAVEFLGNPT